MPVLKLVNAMPAISQILQDNVFNVLLLTVGMLKTKHAFIVPTELSTTTPLNLANAPEITHISTIKVNVLPAIQLGSAAIRLVSYAHSEQSSIKQLKIAQLTVPTT